MVLRILASMPMRAASQRLFPHKFHHTVILAGFCACLAACNPFEETGKADKATVQRDEARIRFSSASVGDPAPQHVNRASKTALLGKSEMGTPISATAGKAARTPPAQPKRDAGAFAQSTGKSGPLPLATLQSQDLTTGAIGGGLDQALDRALGNNNKPHPKERALAAFYRALAGLENGTRNKPVTILHLGDGHIAFDRFAAVARERLQSRFGDAGRGTLMPGYPYPFYRAKGMRFAKSGNWALASAVDPDAKGPFGLSGVSLTAAEPGASLALTAQDKPFDWAEIEVLAGPDRGQAILSVSGGQDSARQIVSPISHKSGAARVRIDQPGTTFTIQADGSGPVTVLSWAVGRNQPGVRYVNLGIPGASFRSLGRIDGRIVSDQLANLAPDLVVLSYGTEDATDDRLDMDSFTRRASALVERLRTLAPTASFVIAGPPDSAHLPQFAKDRLTAPSSAACRALTKDERVNYLSALARQDERLARWHPRLNLAPVRATLQQTANTMAAYYWDWSKVMGGACGIHAWVHADPPLAAADHIHLTEAGAARSANAFMTDLMAGYAAYKRSSQTETPVKRQAAAQ